MASMSAWTVFASVLVAYPLLAADAGKIDGCTPEVKVKPVRETRREVTVGIVGEALPLCYRNRQCQRSDASKEHHRQQNRAAYGMQVRCAQSRHTDSAHRA